MLVALCTAIMVEWNSAPDLDLTIAGGLHFGIAPEKTPKPYGSFHLLGTLSQTTFGGTLQIENPWVQFSIFDNSPANDNIMTYGDAVHTRFRWAALTLGGGWSSLLCVPINQRIVENPMDACKWQCILEYNTRMQK